MARKKPKFGRSSAHSGKQPAGADLSMKSSTKKIQQYLTKALKVVLRFGYFNGLKLGKACKAYAQDVYSDFLIWRETVQTAHQSLRALFGRTARVKGTAPMLAVSMAGGSGSALSSGGEAPRRRRPVILRPIMRCANRLFALPGHIAKGAARAWEVTRRGFLWALTGIPFKEITLPIPAQERKRYMAGMGARAISVGAPVAAVVAFGILLYSAKDMTMGIKVYIDDQQVGIVKNQEDYEKLVDGVESYISSITGEPYVLPVEASFTVALVNKEEFEDQTELTEVLYARASDAITTAYGLFIDGQLIGVTGHGEGLQQLLDEKLDKYRTDAEDERAEFVQDVQVKEALYPKKVLKDLSYFQSLLDTTTTQQKTYVVQKGDMFGTIAKKVGMQTSVLMNMNPSVEATKLREGMEIIIEKAVPLLSVQVVKTVEYTESIPYTVEKIQSSDLYVNQTKVKVKGVEGEARVKAEVVMVDGVEVERNVLERQVISEPVTQQVLMGTKKRPATAATGVLMRPFGGVLTSRFGYRGREYHTGVDLAGSTGSAIKAADGGTVIFAGRSGNYGNIVKISHGNGLETWYAHCSKLYVSKGQKVAKGEVIAAVGSTGRSTGPHLHFEVRKNGVPQNPFNYIN